MLSGGLLNGTRFSLPENAHNVFFRESLRLHVGPPQVEENLTWRWPKIRGALQGRAKELQSRPGTFTEGCMELLGVIDISITIDRAAKGKRCGVALCGLC